MSTYGVRADMTCSHACYAAQARLANLCVHARRPGSLPPSVRRGECWMVHRSLQGRLSKANSHRSGPMAYMKHRRALRYLQLASKEARLCWSVVLFGAYTLADRSFSSTAHGTTSTSQQLPVNIWRLHAIPEDTNSNARDASCSAPISSTPYHEGPARATTCTDL